MPVRTKFLRRSPGIASLGFMVALSLPAAGQGRVRITSAAELPALTYSAPAAAVDLVARSEAFALSTSERVGMINRCCSPKPWPWPARPPPTVPWPIAPHWWPQHGRFWNARTGTRPAER